MDGGGRGGLGLGLEIKMARIFFPTLFPATRGRITRARLECRIGATEVFKGYIQISIGTV